MQHRDEYIYFGTDHHWTADGAYYAYEGIRSSQRICRSAEAGLRNVNLTDF